MANGIQSLIGAAIGLLVITIVVMLGPGVGSQVETALPVDASSDFANETIVATSGADVWGTNVAIISIAVLITIIAVAIKRLNDMRQD